MWENVIGSLQIFYNQGLLHSTGELMGRMEEHDQRDSEFYSPLFGSLLGEN
jgi:hypothetical protein